jgi:hypothetical protein
MKEDIEDVLKQVERLTKTVDSLSISSMDIPVL